MTSCTGCVGMLEALDIQSDDVSGLRFLHALVAHLDALHKETGPLSAGL